MIAKRSLATSLARESCMTHPNQPNGRQSASNTSLMSIKKMIVMQFLMLQGSSMISYAAIRRINLMVLRQPLDAEALNPVFRSDKTK